MRRFTRRGEITGDICSGSGAFGIASALESRPSICIDSDRGQYPLAVAHVQRTNLRVKKQHGAATSKKDSRAEYDSKLSTFRFLYPLDTNLPYSSYKRELAKEAKRQQSIEDALREQERAAASASNKTYCCTFLIKKTVSKKMSRTF